MTLMANMGQLKKNKTIKNKSEVLKMICALSGMKPSNGASIWRIKEAGGREPSPHTDTQPPRQGEQRQNDARGDWVTLW